MREKNRQSLDIFAILRRVICSKNSQRLSGNFLTKNYVIFFSFWTNECISRWELKEFIWDKLSTWYGSQEWWLTICAGIVSFFGWSVWVGLGMCVCNRLFLMNLSGVRDEIKYTWAHMIMINVWKRVVKIKSNQNKTCIRTYEETLLRNWNYPFPHGDRGCVSEGKQNCTTEDHTV